MATVAEKLVIALGLDTTAFMDDLKQALAAADNAGSTAQAAAADASNKADAAAAKAGEGVEEAKKKTTALQKKMQEVDKQFSSLGKKWASSIKSYALTIGGPIAAAFAVWKGFSSYAGQVAEVAQLTGSYSTQLEEWRKKRAMLSRVTREDIELYKKSRTSIVGFQIAMQDLTAKVARQFSPALKWGLDLLNGITKWVSSNQNNIVRFFTVTATVITAVFLPALVRMGAAFLANPLTWVIAALGSLILVFDDLTTYIRGGNTALAGFWSIFGTGEEIGNAIGSILEWITGTVKDLLPYIGAIAGAFAGWKIISTLAILGASGLLKLLGVVRILFVVIGAIGIALQRLSPVLKFLGLGFRGLAKGTVAAFKIMGKAAMGFLSAIMAHPVVAVVTVIIGAIIALISVLVKAFKEGGGTLEGMLSVLRGWIVELTSGLGGFGKFLVALFDAAADAVRTVANVITSLFAEIEAAGGVWPWLKGLAADFASSALSFIEGLINSVLAWFSALPGNVSSALSSLASAISAAFSGALDAVLGLFAAWYSTVSANFIAAFEGIADAVGNIFAALWDWIVSLFDPSQLLAKVKGIASSVLDSFKSAFGFGEDEEAAPAQKKAVEQPIEEAYTAEEAEALRGLSDDRRTAKPVQSNGLIEWANKQPDFNPAGMTPTQNIQNSVSNYSPTYNQAQKNASVQQTNNITINAGGAGDANAMRQALSQEMALQNEKLQRQTLAVESGTRT